MPLGWGRQGYVVVGGFSHDPFDLPETPEQVTAFRQAALQPGDVFAALLVPQRTLRDLSLFNHGRSRLKPLRSSAVHIPD